MVNTCRTHSHAHSVHGLTISLCLPAAAHEAYSTFVMARPGPAACDGMLYTYPYPPRPLMRLPLSEHTGITGHWSSQSLSHHVAAHHAKVRLSCACCSKGNAYANKPQHRPAESQALLPIIRTSQGPSATTRSQQAQDPLQHSQRLGGATVTHYVLPTNTHTMHTVRCQSAMLLDRQIIILCGTTHKPRPLHMMVQMPQTQCASCCARRQSKTHPACELPHPQCQQNSLYI